MLSLLESRQIALGDLSTGGGLILANALTATLQSEPGVRDIDLGRLGCGLT